MQKLKSMAFMPCVALATVMALATPATAGTREGYTMWQGGDFFGAVREWRSAAVAGDPIAQFNLARAYQLGRGVPLDLKMAESWFAKAAAQGHVPSRDNYGLTLFQNGDRDMAMPYIDEAAKRGDPRAQYVLGTALFNGDIVKKDWPRAYAMMTRASAAGLGPASASLVQMDKFIPADQRQRGLTIAREIEGASAKVQLADAMIAEAPASEAPQSAVVAEALPPSRIGAPPVPASKPGAKHTKPVPSPKPGFATAETSAKPGAKPAKPAVAPKPVVATAPTPAPKTAPKPVAKPAVVAAKVAQPVAKPAPKPVPAPSGNWRVQVGAFGEATKAHAAWDAMHKRVGALGPHKASFVGAGKITRIYAGSLPSRDAAEKLCASLKAAGQSCLPVAP